MKQSDTLYTHSRVRSTQIGNTKPNLTQSAVTRISERRAPEPYFQSTSSTANLYGIYGTQQYKNISQISKERHSERKLEDIPTARVFGSSNKDSKYSNNIHSSHNNQFSSHKQINRPMQTQSQSGLKTYRVTPTITPVKPIKTDFKQKLAKQLPNQNSLKNKLKNKIKSGVYQKASLKKIPNLINISKSNLLLNKKIFKKPNNTGYKNISSRKNVIPPKRIQMNSGSSKLLNRISYINSGSSKTSYNNFHKTSLSNKTPTRQSQSHYNNNNNKILNKTTMKLNTNDSLNSRQKPFVHEMRESINIYGDKDMELRSTTNSGRTPSFVKDRKADVERTPKESILSLTASNFGSVSNGNKPIRKGSGLTETRFTSNGAENNQNVLKADLIDSLQPTSFKKADVKVVNESRTFQVNVDSKENQSSGNDPNEKRFEKENQERYQTNDTSQTQNVVTDINPFTRKDNSGYKLDLPDLGVVSTEFDKDQQTNLTDREYDLFINRRKTKYSKPDADKIREKDRLLDVERKDSRLLDPERNNNKDRKTSQVRTVKRVFDPLSQKFVEVVQYKDGPVHKQDTNRLARTYDFTQNGSILSPSNMHKVQKKISHQLEIDVKDERQSQLGYNTTNKAGLSTVKSPVNVPQNVNRFFNQTPKHSEQESQIKRKPNGIVNSASTKNLKSQIPFELKKSKSTIELPKEKQNKGIKQLQRNQEMHQSNVFPKHKTNKNPKVQMSTRDKNKRRATDNMHYEPIYEDFGACPKHLYRLVIFKTEKNSKTDKIFFNNPTNYTTPEQLLCFNTKNSDAKFNTSSRLIDKLKCTQNANFIAPLSKSRFYDMSQVVAKEKHLRPSMYHNLEAFEDDFSFPEDKPPTPKKPKMHHFGASGQIIEKIDENTFKLGGIEFKDTSGRYYAMWKEQNAASPNPLKTITEPSRALRGSSTSVNITNKITANKLSKSNVQHKSSINLHGTTKIAEAGLQHSYSRTNIRDSRADNTHFTSARESSNLGYRSQVGGSNSNMGGTHRVDSTLGTNHRVINRVPYSQR